MYSEHIMSYTSSDLSNIQAAILSLATGERIVSVSFADGKTIEYSRTDLTKLQELRNVIMSEINLLANRPSCILIKTSKGL